jgi:two-component system response regulator MprA
MNGRTEHTIKNTPGNGGTAITLPGLSVNLETKEVLRHNRPVHLTEKEFALLEFLLRHLDQVVSRSQILENVWGCGFVSWSNVVDVHIKNLRKKLKLNGTLITIRGIGYKFKNTKNGNNDSA